MNKIAAIKKLNDTELELGIAGTGASWHQRYLQCDALYVGGLSDTFTEEDLLGVLEQYGTILHVNLVRDSNTNASRGFAFVRYADPRSCILAVDNLSGFEIDGRSLRLDHADDYRDADDAGLDTTPPDFHSRNASVPKHTVGLEDGKPVPVEPTAERRREDAVLNRLAQLRKRRRVSLREGLGGPDEKGRTRSSRPMESFNDQKAVDDRPLLDSSDKNVKRLEKRKRKREKDQRKEERARIRKERAERRAARQNEL